MDDRLEKALAFSKYRTTIENRRKSIKRRFESMLIVHYANGMFKADATTMSFIALLLAKGNTYSIILDVKENPIEVDDLTELFNILNSAYHAATNEYHTETKKLAKARDVKKAMNW